MTLRDCWAESLHCRSCGTTGDAEFSQAGGPAYSHEISVERVPDGFKMVPSEYGSSFYCATCENSVDQK
jgi:hypothetical protein